MSRLFGGLLKWIGALALLLTIAAVSGLLFAGVWLAQDDVPSIADAIVVLGGDFRRPPHAAELYRRGFASTVYVGRVMKPQRDKMMERYGYTVPTPEMVYYRILTTEGVPPDAIRLFGSDLLSTVEEAEELAKRLGEGPGRLIVITSPYHVQRARMIFRHALPGWTVMVSGTPYEPLPTKWWTSQESARNVILEFAKTIFYMLGGGFRGGTAG